MASHMGGLTTDLSGPESPFWCPELGPETQGQDLAFWKRQEEGV